MPLYETNDISRADLEKKRKYNACSQCGSHLALFWDPEKKLAFLACWDWPRTHHEGIQRPPSRWKQEGTGALTIIERREFMTTEIGEHKTRALERYSGVTSLTRDDASTIIATLWPEARGASPAEVFKAISICVQYGLNPLMRHLYLIQFDRYEGQGQNRHKVGTSYVTVLGIGANRLIASRKHAYSYIDDSPRLMSDEEQMKVFGEIDAKNLRAITILKDMKTGATARGYGSWPKAVEPKGVDKGNSKANMAFIRSERQALDRLYPADMPHDVEVVDERYEVTVEPPTQPLPGDSPAEQVKETIEPPTPEAAKPLAPGVLSYSTEESPPASKPKAESGDVDLAALEFATAGEFMAACKTHFGLMPTAVLKEVPIYDLSNHGQRQRAWQYIVGAYGKKPTAAP